MAILSLPPVLMVSTQVLVVLLLLTLEGGLPYADAAAINTTTTVTAQAQDSASTTVAPTAAPIIIQDIIPKSVLTFIGLASFVLLGMAVAKLVDRFHDSVELRDDASDISEHTRDLLKARFALFAFTPAKLQSEADQKAKDLERARKFGRIWMVKAAMSSRKKREEVKKAIVKAANATAAFEVDAESPIRPSVASQVVTSSPIAVTATSTTAAASSTTTVPKEGEVKTIPSTSKQQKSSNDNKQSRPTTANTKSRPTTANTKSRPTTAKTKTVPTPKVNTTAKTVPSTADKPKVPLVSFKPKEDAAMAKNKKTDEHGGASASAAANKVNKAAKRNNDFIAIDIQNLDDSTETREGGSTIPSTPRNTYIDFREISDDLTIPIRVSTDDTVRPRQTLENGAQPLTRKMAYAYSEFGSDVSLRQSVANVVAPPPLVVKTAGRGGTLRSRPSELEIMSLSRDNSFESLPDYANIRQGAKTALGKASTAAESNAAAGATHNANKRAKTPGPVSAQRDSRPVTSRPMTGHATSSRPLTAGRAQPITMGERGKSASRRGR